MHNILRVLVVLQSWQQNLKKLAHLFQVSIFAIRRNRRQKTA